jgi:hypothetical protein
MVIIVASPWLATVDFKQLWWPVEGHITMGFNSPNANYRFLNRFQPKVETLLLSHEGIWRASI